MWLYRLTNKLTGKQYIGTSVHPVSQRISRHVYAAKIGREDMPICDAIAKYGIASFAVDILGETNDYEQLLHMEAQAIIALNTRVPNGYNLTAGGRGTRRPHSPETKALISARTKGRIPWNYGKGPTSRIAHPHRASGKGGPEKGTKPWNFGKKTGALPEVHRRNIGSGVRKVRATKFWSSRQKKSFQAMEASI